MLFRIAIILGFFLCFFSSCSKDESVQPILDYHYDYAPLRVNQALIYSVDSIAYNDFTFPVSIDTFKYFVKNRIEEESLDSEGRLRYKISRSIMWEADSVWHFDRLFSITKTKDELIKMDGNIPIVNLVFPIKQGEEWNGNAYNSRGELIFEYKYVHQSDRINQHSFDSTILVVQHEKKNLLEDEFSMEKYATGLGLVQKQEHFLKTNFQGQIQRGYKLNYRIVLDQVLQ